MNTDSGHIDEKLLLRFLLGEVNKKEIKQVEGWLQLSKENQKLLDSYEVLWAEAGKLTPNPVVVNIPSAWNKMSERVDQYEETKTRTKIILLKSRSIWISSGIAAAIVIVFGVSQLLYKYDVRKQNMLISSNQEIVHDTLPDGSQIALNLNSEIIYPKQFSEKERRIKLSGEAYFKIERNVEQAFIIEAGGAFIEVLGTSFNVKAYENSEIEVIVTEGLVKLYIVDSETMDTSAILLQAGQKGKILIEERNPIYVAEQIPDELFWMDYTLIFNDTDLKKVFELLESYYGIEIKVSNKQVYDCRLSTTFSNNIIDDIMKVITATFDLEFTKEKNIYTIKGNGCSEKNI